MQTLKAVISGKVQGVGFRYFVKTHADDLNLKGYARNLADGRVEVLMQGGAEEIKQLLSLLWQGPRFSSVTSVDHSEYDTTEIYRSFVTR